MTRAGDHRRHRVLLVEDEPGLAESVRAVVEDLDVATTARVMGCSEGAVKTQVDSGAVRWDVCDGEMYSSYRLGKDLPFLADRAAAAGVRLGLELVPDAGLSSAEHHAPLAGHDQKAVQSTWEALQADGSAMYTLQAWWTMAREDLDVVTILFNNSSYAVLNMELQRVGASAGGEKAKANEKAKRPAPPKGAPPAR